MTVDHRPVRLVSLPFALVTREPDDDEYKIRGRFGTVEDALLAKTAMQQPYSDEDIAVLDFSDNPSRLDL